MPQVSPRPPDDAELSSGVDPDPDAAKRNAVVATDIGVSVSAAAGAAGAAATASQGAPAAQAVAMTSAAPGAQTAAVGTKTGGAAIGGKSGGVAVGVKIGAGGVGAAVLIGAILIGVEVAEPATSPIVDPTMNEEITGFDFANTTIVDSEGERFQLVDGQALVPGYEEMGVGYRMAEGPVFTDVDGDNDLDAAVMMRWTAAAGTGSTDTLFLWRWDDGRVEQVDQQVRTAYRGSMTNLLATDDGFQVIRTAHGASVDDPTFEETITIGLLDGDVVRVDLLSAVQPCSPEVNRPSYPVSHEALPLVAPRADATPIDVDVTSLSMTTQDTDVDGDGWVITQIMDPAGPVACGWVPVEHLVR